MKKFMPTRKQAKSVKKELCLQSLMITINTLKELTAAIETRLFTDIHINLLSGGSLYFIIICKFALAMLIFYIKRKETN